MKVQFLWHSFFKISFNGANILLDPFMNMTEGDSTFQPSFDHKIKLEKFKNIDFICVSNEQFDHFDKDLIELIAKKENAVVVGHESVLNELNIPSNLKHKVMSGSKFNLRGVEVEVIESHYPASFYPLGFKISKDGESVYFAGNTTLTDVFSRVDADLALLPIGGNSTMDIIDAVRATKTMKPKYVIPMHYNSFDNISADPSEFKSRIEKSILKTVPIILKPGQIFKT